MKKGIRKFGPVDYLFLGFIFFYTIAALIVPLNRYWQYQDFYFDFGIFDRAIWQVSRFQPPFVDHVDINPFQDILIFADHFNPSMFLLSPLYWLTSRSEILIIAQSLTVVASGIIAYLLAVKLTRHKFVSLALTIAYLGYVGLQNALITDLHDVTLAVLPLMLMFWALNFKKWPLYFGCLLIMLGLKETLAGLGVGLGLYILIKERSFSWIAISTIVISIIWAVLAIGLIIPFFSKGIYLYQPKELPRNAVEFVNRFTSPPLKVKSIAFTYLTFGIIPIFNPAILPAVLENYFERFILADDRGIDLGMHYNAPLAPLMFIGALDVLLWWQKHKKIRILNYYALFVIATVFLLHQRFIHGPLALAYNPVFYEQNRRVKYVDNFLSQVPDRGLIMTQNDLATRFTHWRVKLLRINYKSISPDLFALNLTPGQNPNSFFPLSFMETVELKDRLLSDPDYQHKKFADQLYLFEKIK